jgi:N-acetylmuramoyl-L-alanine amidase
MELGCMETNDPKNTNNVNNTKKKSVPAAVWFMIFVFALLILSIGLIDLFQGGKPAAAPDAQSRQPAKLDCLIVLDAGHGGADCGAIGSKTGVHEDKLNLDVAQKLQKLLVEAGARVIMTRETDDAIADNKNADMEKRRVIIKDSGADIVVSIHMNFFTDTTSSGPQVFYYETSMAGRTLAMRIQDKMNEILDPASPRSQMKADYFILRAGDMPAVIVECGFLSNANEEMLLQEDKYRQNIAQSVLEGIQAYFTQSEDNDTMEQ